jgi:hypothetical protein
MTKADRLVERVEAAVIGMRIAPRAFSRRRTSKRCGVKAVWGQVFIFGVL